MAIDPVYKLPVPGLPGREDAEQPGGEDKVAGRSSADAMQRRLFAERRLQDLGSAWSAQEGVGSGVQVDLSQNVSMGVNKNAAQLLIETEVRKSLATQVIGDAAAAPRPVFRPGDENLEAEEIAGRLIDYAMLLINGSDSELTSGEEEIARLREAAEAGFASARGVLDSSPTQDTESLVGEVRTVFMELLGGLQETAGSSGRPPAVEENQVAEIAAENRRALEETGGRLDPTGLFSNRGN